MLVFGAILVCICPNFRAFRLNKESHGISLRIQSECGKNADETNSEYGPFLRSVCVSNQRVKSVQIPSFFWSVFSCIHSEDRKIRNRKNSVFGHFSRSEPVAVVLLECEPKKDFMTYCFLHIVNLILHPFSHSILYFIINWFDNEDTDNYPNRRK